jgi:glutathione S-transferase
MEQNYRYYTIIVVSRLKGLLSPAPMLARISRRIRSRTGHAMSSHSVVLYHGLASTCSKKVRMCLYEKGVAFESHLLDLQRFEQHSPEYLAINPNGVVPTLVHDGHVIVESSVIIDFIDDAYPQNPLKPIDVYERAAMRLWVKYSDETAYKAVYVPTWHRLHSRAQDGLNAINLDETLARIPTAERRERWAKMAKGGYSDKDLETAYEAMRACLDSVEASLRKSLWLAGNEFSLADVAMLPFIDRIANLKPEFLDVPQCSAVRDWLARAAERPSFSRAIQFTEDPRASELPNL